MAGFEIHDRDEKRNHSCSSIYCHVLEQRSLRCASEDPNGMFGRHYSFNIMSVHDTCTCGMNI